MKLYPTLSDDLAAWAQRQPVFFTGSAPTHGPHINVSPKGMAGTHFAVLSPTRCAYIDRTGSGCETIAHAYDNGRLCLMFMSFGPSPRIMRLFCRAEVIEWDRPAFPGMVRAIANGKREAFDGARAVIVCDIWEVQTSCGYAVPRVKKGLYAPGDDAIAQSAEKGSSVTHELLHSGTAPGERLDELAVFEERPTLDTFAAHKVEKDEMHKYQAATNVSSIDGLPGLRAARREGAWPLWAGDLKARARNILAEREALGVGFLMAILMYFVAVAVGVLK